MGLPNTVRHIFAARIATTRFAPFYMRRGRKAMAPRSRMNPLTLSLPLVPLTLRKSHMVRVVYDPPRLLSQYLHLLRPCGERAARTKQMIIPTALTLLLCPQLPAGQTRILLPKQVIVGLVKLAVDLQQVHRSPTLHHLLKRLKTPFYRRQRCHPKYLSPLGIRLHREPNHHLRINSLGLLRPEGGAPNQNLTPARCSISSSPISIHLSSASHSTKRLSVMTS